MVVEFCVFYCDGGILEVGRYLVEGDRSAANGAVDVVENDVPGAVENLRRFSHLTVLKVVDGRNGNDGGPQDGAPESDEKERHDR